MPIKKQLSRFSYQLFPLFPSRLLLILWILGIGYVSLTPSPERDFPLYLSLGALTLHILAFSVLFVLFYLSFPQQGEGTRRRLGRAFIYTLMISFAKELAQHLVPNRFFSFEDLLIDGLSAALAGLIVGFYDKFIFGKPLH